MFGTRISLPSPGMVLSSRSRYLEGRYYCFNLTDGLSSCKVHFYPAALACKLPLSVLALIALALVGSWRNRATLIPTRLGSVPLLLILTVFVEAQEKKPKKPGGAKAA